MSVRTYWVGSRFVAEWTLVDDAGAAVTDATVTGEVRLPGGATAAMSVTSASNVYAAGYTVTAAGTHGYGLLSTGTAQGAEEGTFVVARSKVGLAPITVDPTTSIGLVRLLCTDLNETEPLFEDSAINAFLTAEGSVAKRAAALALETIARSEALTSKKITTSDGLSTDGPALAKELRDNAAALRKQAAEELGLENGAGVLPRWSFPDPPIYGDDPLL